MAVFKDEQKLSGRLDWTLFRDGPVHQYLNEALLNTDLEWLRAEHYEVIEFDCRDWPDEREMHRVFKEALRFPDYYGMNLDAFNDCIRSDFRPEGTGAVVVLKGLEALPENGFREGMSTALLEILASASWWHLLFGNRFLTFVTTGDERLPALTNQTPQRPWGT